MWILKIKIISTFMYIYVKKYQYFVTKWRIRDEALRTLAIISIDDIWIWNHVACHLYVTQTHIFHIDIPHTMSFSIRLYQNKKNQPANEYNLPTSICVLCALLPLFGIPIKYKHNIIRINIVAYDYIRCNHQVIFTTSCWIYLAINWSEAFGNTIANIWKKCGLSFVFMGGHTNFSSQQSGVALAVNYGSMI